MRIATINVIPVVIWITLVHNSMKTWIWLQQSIPENFTYKGETLGMMRHFCECEKGSKRLKLLAQIPTISTCCSHWTFSKGDRITAQNTRSIENRTTGFHKWARCWRFVCMQIVSGRGGRSTRIFRADLGFKMWISKLIDPRCHWWEVMKYYNLFSFFVSKSLHILYAQAFWWTC